MAGKQKGREDDRYLWPEMLRVIRELAPRWVIGENVPGILNIAADTICADLEREGYEVGIFDFEAAAVGAPHRRERIAFVGHSKHNGRNGLQELRSDETAGNERRKEKQKPPWQLARTGESADVPSVQGCTEGSECAEDVSNNNEIRLQGARSEQQTAGVAGVREDVSSTNETRLQRQWREHEPLQERTAEHTIGNCSEKEFGISRQSEPRLGRMVDGLSPWLDEPDIPRVATGIKNRVDRLKCLGNAVVPQQFYPIFKAIADYETQPPSVRNTIVSNP